MHNKGWPITGWKWIFYVIGWISGAGSLLFWAIMVAFYFVRQEKTFFNNNFHYRVFIWGVLNAILGVIMFFILMFIIISIPILIGTQ